MARRPVYYPAVVAPTRLRSAARRLWPAGHALPVLLIFAVAFGLRVAWMRHSYPDDIVFTSNPLLFGDEVFYFFSAAGLAAGDGYRDPLTGELTSLFPPGFPFALTPLFVVFGTHLLVAKLFNVTLSALTAVLVYALATRVAGRRAGLLAGGLMAAWPGQVLFSGLVMTEPLFVALSVVLVLALTVWLRDEVGVRPWQAIVLGLLLGYMSLVRAEALLLLGAVPALWLVEGISWRRIASAGPLLLLGAALVIAPWTARNYARFDEFILLRGGAGDPSRVVRIGMSVDYEKWQQYKNEQLPPDGFGEIAGDYAREPWQVAVVAGKKLHDLFGRDDPMHYVRARWLEVYYQDPPLSDAEAHRWSLLSNWYYYVVAGWAVLSAPLWSPGARGPLRVVLWFSLSWTLVYVLFVPDFRYHFPVVPMLAVLAACGTVALWDALARRGAEPSLTSDRASGITEQR